MNNMSYNEMIGWTKYYKVRPHGWRDDQRTALVVQGFGAKVKAEELFPSLNAVYSESRIAEAREKKKWLTNGFIAKLMAEDETGTAFKFLKE